MTEYSSAERHDSWFERLAAKFGFNNSVDARSVVEEAISSGTAFSVAEQTILTKTLNFQNVRVEDVCVPRAEIVALEDTESVATVMATYAKNGLSRIPLYKDTLDKPIGMIHVTDVMTWLSAKAEARGAGAQSLSAGDLQTPINKTGLCRDVLFVPPGMSALDLLAKMQKRRILLALVIDEHGGTDGLVTIEDLLEEVVGEIHDEHDTNAPLIVQEADGFVADARAGIEEVEEKIGRSLLAKTKHTEDVDTLAGLVVTMLGRVPVRGETVSHPAGLDFVILEADRRRVKKLKIKLPPDSDEGAENHTHAA